MAFLYFFPGVKETGLTADNIRQRLGLGYLGDAHLAKCEALKGPDDCGAGLVVSYGDTRPSYLPDAQTWRKSPIGDVFLGNYLDNPPSPSSLARQSQIRGYDVKLTDGNTWHIPTARAITDDSEPYCALPRVSAIQSDGTWANTQVRADHSRLWEIACNWWDILAAAAESGDTSYSFDEENAWCVEAIQCNYLVGAAEVSYLGLLDDESRGEILGALVDFPKMLRLAAEAEKKTTHTSQQPELVASG